MRPITSEEKAFDESAEVGADYDSVEHQITLAVTDATTGHFLVNVKAMGASDYEAINQGGAPLAISATTPESVTGIRIAATHFQVVPVGLNAEATYTATVISYPS